MEENVVRKKPARKVVRKTVTRKAPTQVESTVVRERGPMLPFVAIGVFLLIVGVSVAVGFSDSGAIDVEDTINTKRETGTEEERAALESIPVQRKRPSAPNGGLVPTTDADPGAPAVVEEEVSTSTASTTEETAGDAETETETEAGEGVEEGGNTASETTDTSEPPAEEIAPAEIPTE